jgi:hypothetical protein
MIKIVIGFALFSVVALYILSTGGEIDMSGEKHGGEATHAEPDKTMPAATVVPKVDPASK